MNILTLLLFTLTFIAEGFSQGQKNWLMNNQNEPNTNENESSFTGCLKFLNWEYTKNHCYAKQWHWWNTLFIFLFFTSTFCLHSLFEQPEAFTLDWFAVYGIQLAFLVGFRFLSFDYAHNYMFKQAMHYTGATSFFDRITGKFSVALFYLRIDIAVILAVELIFYY